jgi:azurin
MTTGGMRRTRMAWLNAVAAPADWAEATALHIEHWENREIGVRRNTADTESSIQ